ncbi:MAG: hypothetical protein U5L09_01725 [Bacteroidales bacterium]|nr:hypothetical protein [Bacteroidales bacterium]
MKKSSLARDISGVFSSNVFAIASTLLMGVIIARYLGPEGKGTFTALTVVPVIVVSFTAMGIRRDGGLFYRQQSISRQGGGFGRNTYPGCHQPAWHGHYCTGIFLVKQPGL